MSETDPEKATEPEIDPSDAGTNPETRPDKLPPAARYLFQFQISNAFCWSILLSFPIVLYFKSLGASATLLGIVMGTAPLLAVLQIPSAGFVEQVGYRKFVFIGWAVRTTISVGMAAVVICTPWLGSTVASWIMLGLLIGFATARGISSTGVLPWFTQLIPSSVRGRYLSFEQMSLLGSVVFTSLGSALVFKMLPGNTGFAAIISFASFAGVISLFHLSRIPDVEVREEQRKTRQKVPWAALLGHRNFQRILVFNVINLAAWTGGSVCIVPMLSDQFDVGDGTFMVLHGAWSIASVVILLGVRGLLDSTGSKPLLQTALITQFFHFGVWGLVAARVLPLNLPVLAFTQISWGLIHAFYTSSNMRLVMETVPAMGRSHFFAIFTVVNSLAGGLFPVAWGMIIDGLEPLQLRLGSLAISDFALLYAVIAVISIGNSIALARIQETGVMSFQKFLNELLIQTPAKGLSRLAIKRPYFR
jgi:MFS family permease